MMKHLLFTLLATVLLTGCTNEPDIYTPPEPPPDPMGRLRLKVSPMWDGAPFESDVVYQNVMDYRVEIQLLKIYLSDLLLLNGPAEHSLSDVELFNLSNGPQQFEVDVPPGDYTGLHFGIGLPPALNASDPVLYPADHPLSASNGMYWTWASKYRFVIFDGRFDTDPNGVGAPPELLSIHTGNDSSYREVEFAALPIRIGPDSITEVDLQFDLSKFFYTSNDTIDIAVDNQSHDGIGPLPQRLSDCIAGSVTAE